MKTSVAVIDDHQLVRDGIVRIVNDMPDFKVSIVASNGKDFIAGLSGQENPNLALVDIHMPEMNGYETIAFLKERHPDIKCLSLTLDNTEDAITKTIRAGARGYLRKNCSPRVLHTALKSVAEFGFYHTEQTQELLTGNPGMRTVEERTRTKLIGQITEREMEFLKHVCASGEYTYEEIADRMGISRRTVDDYRSKLFEKFNIKSKAGLVLFVVKWKLFDLD